VKGTSLPVRAVCLRAAGTNCDRETDAALALAGAASRRCLLDVLCRDAAPLERADLLVLAGGFSYGDDLGAGRILAHRLRHDLRDPIRRLLARGGLVLGICNGFQALVQAGLLPGGVSAFSGEAGALCDPPFDDRPVTLSSNRSGHFETRWIHLRSTGARTPWLAGIDRMELPVAHAEGRLVARDDEVLDALEAGGQVALRYVAPDGGPAEGYPQNPNGSARDIAGLIDPTGQILGLMPHPERWVWREQHPRWTRGLRAAGDPPPGAGLRIFENAVRHVEMRAEGA